MLISPLAWGVAICAVYGVRYDVSPARPTRVAGVELGIVYQYTYASRSLLNFFFFVCQVETTQAQSSDQERGSMESDVTLGDPRSILPPSLRASAGSGLFGIVYRESRIDGPPSLGRQAWDAG
jgi:hypothetical protein